jgi:hypothetical protein
MRLAELAALTQRGVRVSQAGGLVSQTMASTDNGFLNRALGFGTMCEDLGWRRLYIEVDWVRTT